MISKRKFMRDIIVIVVLVFIYIIADKMFFSKNKTAQPTNPHANMMGSITADTGTPSSFDIDNTTIAIKIDGVEYTIGDIDNQAKIFYVMMNGPDAQLTLPARNVARRQAIQRMLADVAMNKGIQEFGIEISEADVDKMLNELIEEQGGKKELDKFLAEINVTVDSLRKRMRKDLVQNALFDAVIETNIAQDKPEEEQHEIYSKWIDEISKQLEVDIVDKEIYEIFMGQTGHEMPPQGMMGQGMPGHGMPPQGMTNQDDTHENCEPGDH